MTLAFFFMKLLDTGVSRRAATGVQFSLALQDTTMHRATTTTNNNTTPTALLVVAVLCLGLATVHVAEACVVVRNGETVPLGNLCTECAVPLTPALYLQGKNVYETATCIAPGAFAGASGDVIIEGGLPQLTVVGEHAFSGFTGKLVLTGAFPKLRDVQGSAFLDAATATSVLDFGLGLANLTTVGSKAFNRFRGKLLLSGAFPQLRAIQSYAFYYAGTTTSMLDFSVGLPALATVGKGAFTAFRGSIIFGGDYPPPLLPQKCKAWWKSSSEEGECDTQSSDDTCARRGIHGDCLDDRLKGWQIVLMIPAGFAIIVVLLCVLDSVCKGTRNVVPFHNPMYDEAAQSTSIIVPIPDTTVSEAHPTIPTVSVLGLDVEVGRGSPRRTLSMALVAGSGELDRAQGWLHTSLNGRSAIVTPMVEGKAEQK